MFEALGYQHLSHLFHLLLTKYYCWYFLLRVFVAIIDSITLEGTSLSTTND
jgi:hypothetical protein